MSIDKRRLEKLGFLVELFNENSNANHQKFKMYFCETTDLRYSMSITKTFLFFDLAYLTVKKIEFILVMLDPQTHTKFFCLIFRSFRTIAYRKTEAE